MCEGRSLKSADLLAQDTVSGGPTRLVNPSRVRKHIDVGSYIADDLARWLEHKDMQHVRGAPYHPQTQRKIDVGIRR